MARYEFLTTWCVDVPIERVFGVLHDSAAFPEWWNGVTAVEILEPGDAAGVGERSRWRWRSALPYTLSFDSQVTRIEAPYLIEGRATGELAGTGTWRLFSAPGRTAVIYSWHVRTTRLWMNIWGPLARPAFRWNHDHVMRQGGIGLAARLGASLLIP